MDIPFLSQILQEIPKVNTLLNVVILWVCARILKQAKITNGRILKLECWQDSHEKQDDERHDEVISQLKEDRRQGERRRS